MPDVTPRIIVFSTLFPHPGSPRAGVFIRERMFRVGKHLPIVVVAPQPWFPFQNLICIWRPYFRPTAPAFEIQDGVEVYHPKFFCIPGLLKQFDGLFVAISSFLTLHKLRSRFRFNVLDSHFAYPDGYGATLLGKWFKVPVTITLRGTEVPLSRFSQRRKLIVKAIEQADRVFSVSGSLKTHVQSLGAGGNKIRVVGNGVDTTKFYPMDRMEARSELGLPGDALILISVGALVDRKGFHRVIALLPEIKIKFPNLIYLIVGEGGPEGDIGQQLRDQVESLNLKDTVKFLGAFSSDRLRVPLSAANLFTLATANEGWANVLLEAMACGLSVVTTYVGGNKEVVNQPELGSVVPFGEPKLLLRALVDALSKNWDRQKSQRYAEENSWDSRVAVLLEEFTGLVNRKKRRV